MATYTPPPDRHAEKDATPKDRGDAIPVAQTRQYVRIILVDGRPGNPARRIELFGRMDMPVYVYAGNVRSTWRFDELQNPLKGIVCDPQPSGANIVFPIVDPSDARDTEGHDLSVTDLKNLFLKYHPELKVAKDI